MTNTVLLQKIIKDSGIKKGRLASAIGVSYSTLKRKILNKSPFKAIEIQIICELLCIDSELKETIFFAEDVGK